MCTYNLKMVFLAPHLSLLMHLSKPCNPMYNFLEISLTVGLMGLTSESPCIELCCNVSLYVVG